MGDKTGRYYRSSAVFGQKQVGPFYVILSKQNAAFTLKNFRSGLFADLIANLITDNSGYYNRQQQPA
jgi:hypothetical protein